MMKNEDFKHFINQQGKSLYRDMPWRRDTRPYYVLVSELMLQQTQVARVIPKFQAFIARFPNEKTLAVASLADVLQLWQGLGYNRRAKFLHEAAKMIVYEYNGVFPEDDADIMRLPGVGKNTCGAIRAYAFNRPSIFVETNVRTVYIHHFFADTVSISDTEIIRLLENTLDRDRPREFYWALMDYGSWLKTNGVRNVAKSKHYIRQSKLEGSIRQVRGRIVSVLSTADMNESDLRSAVQADERFDKALDGLIHDGLVGSDAISYYLTK